VKAGTELLQQVVIGLDEAGAAVRDLDHGRVELLEQVAVDVDRLVAGLQAVDQQVDRSPPIRGLALVALDELLRCFELE